MRSENLSGRTIAGYRLLERVGEGGTATVYRAEHDVHGRCAVKTLRANLASDPTAVKRFLREASYCARVKHPGVVRTYDYGEEDGLYYLALEWVDGEPLSRAVVRAGPFPPDLVADLVEQLADALAAAHAQGIIHRDLKPENVLYDAGSRRVKLLDFGIARDAQEDPRERLTRTGFFVGTLQYVAPEALSGELVDERADIYSLATITYYMLTGFHPHPGKTPSELFRRLLNEDPIPLNQAGGRKFSFPRALEEAVMKGLSRNPAERQQSVLEFAREVREAVDRTKEQNGGRGWAAKLRGLLGRGRRGS
jgi:serine/threonine-protein kinase